MALIDDALLKRLDDAAAKWLAAINRKPKHLRSFTETLFVLQETLCSSCSSQRRDDCPVATELTSVTGFAKLDWCPTCGGWVSERVGGNERVVNSGTFWVVSEDGRYLEAGRCNCRLASQAWPSLRPALREGDRRCWKPLLAEQLSIRQAVLARRWKHETPPNAPKCVITNDCNKASSHPLPRCNRGAEGHLRGLDGQNKVREWL